MVVHDGLQVMVCKPGFVVFFLSCKETKIQKMIYFWCLFPHSNFSIVPLLDPNFMSSVSICLADPADYASHLRVGTVRWTQSR